MSRLFLVSATALAVVAGSQANAAAPAPSVQPWSWTGFYLGGHLGAGWGDKWWNSTGQTVFGGPINSQDIGQNFGTTSVDGFLGGGQIGYNYQTGRFVLGIEADASATGMKGQFACPAISGRNASTTFSTCSSKIDWMGTIVGRVGITIDRALVYVGGGGAWTHEKDHVDCTDFDCGFPGERIFTWDGSKTNWGWTFVGGVEYAIDNHWSAKLQYNYYNFGSDTVLLTPNQTTGCFSGPGNICYPFDVTTQLRIHTFKAGLNYRFDWGRPAGAYANLPPIYNAPAAPGLNWTGFYLGGHLGAGWGNKWWNSTGQNPFGDPISPQDVGQNFGTTSVDGFLGGGQIGFNYQTSRLVWGVEADLSAADLQGKFPCAAIAGAPAFFSTCSSKIDWMGTIVGRVGITIDRALVYVGGGGAWAHEKDHLDCTDRDCGVPRERIFTWDGSKTNWGWTFLAGVEYAIDNHWSAKLQYNFYDFGSDTVTLVPNQPTGCFGVCNPFDVTTQLRIHTFKAGLNYRFDWSRPAGAYANLPPIYNAPAAPGLNWTGVYLGGHLGAGWGNKWWDSTGFDAFGSPFAPQDVGQNFGTTSIEGFLGGGQIGLNYQTGRLVWGVETDASATNMKGQFPCAIIAGVFDAAELFSTCSSKINWMGTIVGRLGVTVDRALVYVGGGGAWAHEKDHLDCTDRDCGVPFNRIFSWDGAKTSWGWTFVAGVEYAIDNRWSAKLQYNFYDFGSETVTLIPNQTTGCFGGVCNPFDVTTQLRIHTLKLGLNYRFN